MNEWKKSINCSHAIWKASAHITYILVSEVCHIYQCFFMFFSYKVIWFEHFLCSLFFFSIYLLLLTKPTSLIKWSGLGRTNSSVYPVQVMNFNIIAILVQHEHHGLNEWMNEIIYSYNVILCIKHNIEFVHIIVDKHINKK